MVIKYADGRKSVLIISYNSSSFMCTVMLHLNVCDKMQPNV